MSLTPDQIAEIRERHQPFGRVWVPGRGLLPGCRCGTPLNDCDAARLLNALGEAELETGRWIEACKGHEENVRHAWRDLTGAERERDDYGEALRELRSRLDDDPPPTDDVFEGIIDDALARHEEDHGD